MGIRPVAGIGLSKRGNGYRVAARRRAGVTRGHGGNAIAAAAGDNSRGRKNQYHCHPEGQAPRTASHARGKRHNHQEEKRDRKSTRLNSSHLVISYAVFCLKKKKKNTSESTLT